MKNKTIWIVTTEYNEYDQYGEYFVACFLEKPSKSELKELLKNEYISDITIDYLFDGGGRQDVENQWWYLEEVKVGENYRER